jgi:NCAIR mutase (PurE)-related protein
MADCPDDEMEDVMDVPRLNQLLKDVADGARSPAEAVEILRKLPYEDMGYAKIDTHRALRTGRAEVVFGIGKTPEQVAAIMKRLAESASLVITTKATPQHYEATKTVFLSDIDHLDYNETAQMLIYRSISDGDEETSRCDHDSLPVVAVVCAGTADIPIGEEAALTAELYGCTVNRHFDVGVAGIHRLLERIDGIRHADVVIAVAGME